MKAEGRNQKAEVLWKAFAISFCLLPSAFCLAAQQAPQYEVYAIRYATIPDFPVAGLIADADKTRKLDIAMMVWLVRGGGKNVLIDSGFYRPQFFKSWTVKDFVRPDEAVAKLGIKPDEITDVILTHAHWDHADGSDLFPKAQVWIQKDEYAYYTGEAWQPGGKHGGIDPDDVSVFVRTNVSQSRRCAGSAGGAGASAISLNDRCGPQIAATLRMSPL